ncbi:MAG: type IV pilin N-terminal domain-containing protein [Thermoplasmatales archaeon]|nr:MAG: type IV pilin N-terminal domain-containing protein [Thermoplasmatales archaeon]
MISNKIFVENREAISAVIGVILMVAITVAIAATTFIYFTGMLGAPQEEAENAAISVLNDNGKIKITLVSGGDNLPSTGYSFLNSVTIRLNGTILDETGINVGNTGWDIGESLFIGDVIPVIDDLSSDVTQLGVGDYSITVTIIKTVIYDDIVTVI